MTATADLLVNVKGDTSHASGALGKLGGKLGGVGKLAAAGAVGAGVAIAGLGAAGIKTFAGFEKGMNEVFTLMPGISEKAMGAMSDDVLDLSKKMGVLPDEVIPALYDSISAGVPPDSVFEFLETATKASIGGVTDLGTAVDGITSTVNAFGSENITAAEASDKMFTAVKLGKTTMEELSKSLFNVNPIAAGLGVEFGDVAASLAVLTAQGVPTSVAATQMKGALAELGKKGSIAFGVFDEMTEGKTFQQFVKEGGNVEQALSMMADRAEEMGVPITDFFGSIEAGQAAMALTSESGAEAFSKAMEEMGNSAGASEDAFKQMDQGLSRSWDKIKAQGSAALIQLGKAIAPVVEKIVDWFVDVLPGAIEWAQDAFANMKPTIDKVVQFLSVAIPGAIDALVESWQAIAPIVSAAFGVISSVIETFVGWFSSNATSSVGSAVDGWTSKFQGLIDFLKPIWDTIVEIISVASAVVTKVVELAVSGISALWENHGKKIMDTVSAVFNTIRDVIKGVMDVIAGILKVVMGILTGDWDKAWEGIKQIFDGVWDAITALLRGAWEIIETIIVLGLDLIENIWSTAWNAIKTFVGAIFDGIFGFISDRFSEARDFISNTLDAITGFFTDKFGSVSSTTSEVFGGILDVVTDKINAVKSFLSGILETIRGLFGGKFGEALDVVTDKINAVKRIIETVINGVKSFIRDALSAMTAIFRGEFGDSVGIVSEMLGKIEGVVKDIAGNAWNWALSIGKAIIDGIVAGIGNLASTLKSKLSSAIGSAVSSVKSIFGISSPSKVFAEQIGKPIAAGIVQAPQEALDWTQNLSRTMPQVQTQTQSSNGGGIHIVVEGNLFGASSVAELAELLSNELGVAALSGG